MANNIKFSVKGPKDVSVEIDIPPTASVGTLLDSVEEKLRQLEKGEIVIDNLYYEMFEMEHHKKIGDYGIEEKDVIAFTQLPPSGSPVLLENVREATFTYDDKRLFIIFGYSRITKKFKYIPLTLNDPANITLETSDVGELTMGGEEDNAPSDVALKNKEGAKSTLPEGAEGKPIFQKRLTLPGGKFAVTTEPAGEDGKLKFTSDVYQIPEERAGAVKIELKTNEKGEIIVMLDGKEQTKIRQKTYDQEKSDYFIKAFKKGGRYIADAAVKGGISGLTRWLLEQAFESALV